VPAFTAFKNGEKIKDFVGADSSGLSVCAASFEEALTDGTSEHDSLSCSVSNIKAEQTQQQMIVL
jgi:hypothetical protein